MIDGQAIANMVKSSGSLVNNSDTGARNERVSIAWVCLNMGEKITWHTPQAERALEIYAGALRAVGLNPEVYEVEHDGVYYQVLEMVTSPGRVKKIRTRRAGRTRQIPYSSLLRNMTAQDALTWLNNHTIEECQEALGVSRSQVYKTKKALKEIAIDYPDTKDWHGLGQKWLN